MIIKVVNAKCTVCTLVSHNRFYNIWFRTLKLKSSVWKGVAGAHYAKGK